MFNAEKIARAAEYFHKLGIVSVKVEVRLIDQQKVLCMSGGDKCVEIYKSGEAKLIEAREADFLK